MQVMGSCGHGCCGEETQSLPSDQHHSNSILPILPPNLRPAMPILLSEGSKAPLLPLGDEWRLEERIRSLCVNSRNCGM